MSSSDDLLQKIRLAKKQQYIQLRQEEKPKLETCPDCFSYPHLTSICPATGKRHDLHQKKLVGGSLVEKDCRSFAGSLLRNAVTLDRVKWEAQRTTIVRVDTMAIHIFQSFVASLGWNFHRFGILYGMYNTYSKELEVHAIYEPPVQHGNAFSFAEVARNSSEGIAAWKEEQQVNRLACALGLRRVGVVCTHPPERSGATLSARELLLCAREQSIYGDECVLLTVAAPSTPTTTGGSAKGEAEASMDEGVSHCESWQVSRQCVQLYQMDLLGETPWKREGASEGRRLLPDEGEDERKRGAGEKARPSSSPTGTSGSGGSTPSSASASPTGTSPSEPSCVWCRIPLELTEEKRDPASGKLEFQTLAPSETIDIHWFTSCVAVERFDSEFFTNAFMRRRKGFGMPTGMNLKQYWTEPKRENHTFVEKVSDFQVLLFLLQALGEKAMLGTCGDGGEKAVGSPTGGGGRGAPMVGGGEASASTGWAALLRKFKGIPLGEKKQEWWEGKIGDRMCSTMEEGGEGGLCGAENTEKTSFTTKDFEELKNFSSAVRELMKISR